MVSKKCKLNFIQIQTIKSHSVFFTVGALSDDADTVIP